MPDLTEKQGLETGAVSQFAEAFTSEAGRGTLVFDKLLDPPLPDARCVLNGIGVFVEVAHLYGTSIDARLLLGRTGRAAPTHKEHLTASCVPLDRRLLNPLDEILAQKAAKTYSASPTWLLIRNGFPLWTREDFELHRYRIAIPQRHSFSEIWLLCGPRSDLGLLRLT
jgi:hypothetical protein